MVVGSTLLVVGSVLVVVTSVVVVGAAVVVGAVVVVVGAAVVVGPVTGGWALVAPTVENASLLVVEPALAGVWAEAGSGALVALPTTGSPLSRVGVEREGAVVGARGPVVDVDTDLAAGSAGTVDSARAGTWRSGDN